MFIENIKSPADVKNIPLKKLPILAEEIRKEIIQVVAKNGGHLASSLGVVELAIALCYCLDLPKDKIVWDVGHQSYAYKLLTGRYENFKTLRTLGGISGFPCREESIYDPFTTGHSSTAVSLALGLANKKFKVTAVIGDGSISGGLCFEGLNNAGHLKKNLLVVLNTNEMSIEPVVGAISTHLNKIISMPIYNRFRTTLDHFIKEKIPRVGPRILKLKDRFEESFKNLLIPGIFFEELGFRYFGPFDGHNLEILIQTLNNILSINTPVLLHVVTKKGKGYAPAEKEPVRFHGTSGFDIDSGEGRASGKRTYGQVFSKCLVELAKDDERIVAITAAMPEGTGLDIFRDKYPSRFYDVGIAEAHSVCFAAGLVLQGLRPVVAVYSTFLQRAYDQVVEDAALQKLPIVFAIDRAGIVGKDGVTHQGLFDICYLRHIPNMTIMAPKDAKELEIMLKFAIAHNNGPIAIRYPRAEVHEIQFNPEPIALGRPEILRYGKDILIFALGSMVKDCLEVYDMLDRQDLFATVLNARFVKPLDISYIKELAKNAKYIFSVEEGVIEGGFGSALMEILERPITRIGLPSEFIAHGARDILLEKYGLNKQGIFDIIVNIVKKNPSISHKQ